MGATLTITLTAMQEYDRIDNQTDDFTTTGRPLDTGNPFTTILEGLMTESSQCMGGRDAHSTSSHFQDMHLAFVLQ